MMRRWIALLMSLLLVCSPVVSAEETAAEPTQVAETQQATQAPEVTPAPTEESTAEPTEAPTAAPTEAPTEVPATEAPTAEPTQAPTEVPTEAPSEAPTQEPVSELQVDFSATVKYGYAHKRPIEGRLTITGGKAPYTVSYRVFRGGDFLTTLPSETVRGSFAFSYMPTARGEYRIEAVVEDACGNTDKDSFSMRVAEKDHRTDEHWIAQAEAVELTGNWGADLLNVAISQLGNAESETDFIITREGTQGYTIYGDASGGDYRAWCAAFVAWCAGYIDVLAADFPTSYRSREWKSDLIDRGAYVTDIENYEPKPGDLIFFNHEGGKVPQHIGIVEKVEDGMVHTVEGNHYRSVCRDAYPLDFEEIIGYGNVSLLQQQAIARAETE